MRVLFLTQYDALGSSSRTRVYQFVPHLEREGIRCKIVPVARRFLYRGALLGDGDRKVGRALYLAMSWLATLVQGIRTIGIARRYDVVFVQRVIFPLGLERILRSLNDRVVFDFDDAIFAREEGGSRGILSRIVEKRTSRGLPRMLRAAKCVIVENAYTMAYAQRYARHVAVITGPIDTNRYLFDKETATQRNGEKVSDGEGAKDLSLSLPLPCSPAPLQTGRGVEGLVIGWIGSPGTVRYLESLRGVLRQLAEKHPEVSVMVIGARFSVDGVQVVHRTWRLETEVEDLRRFDVGMMPLPDNAWTRGKGGYKLLQYMAMGIPAVASPVGINRDIVEDGVNGFLAKDEREWVEKLSLLIERPDLRRQFRQAGRRTVEERYSLEVSVPRFVEVLRKVCER